MSDEPTTSPALMTDQECLRYVNETPELLNFLYDADLCPEQCKPDSINRTRMRMICNLWRFKKD